MTLAIDSSALVAIMRGESEASRFVAALSASDIIIGWPTIFETRIVCVRQIPDRLGWLDQFLAAQSTCPVVFDGALEKLATHAFAHFGKGAHPAKLNFGDCMAYAVAKSRDLPLLFKGGDFGLTDVRIHEASVKTA